MATIDQEKLKEVTMRKFSMGGHDKNDGLMCVMEAVSYVTGSEWSDAPPCVCPVIAEMMRVWNDGLSKKTVRTQVLAPLIPVIVGSDATHDVQSRRAAMMMDWAIRVSLPMRLRCVGRAQVARDLESLPEINLTTPFAHEDYARELTTVRGLVRPHGSHYSPAERGAMRAVIAVSRWDDDIALMLKVTGDTSFIHINCLQEMRDSLDAALNRSATELIHRLVSIKTQEQEERDQAIRTIMIGMGKSSGLGS